MYEICLLQVFYTCITCVWVTCVIYQNNTHELHIRRTHVIHEAHLLWPRLAAVACGFTVTYTCCGCLWFSHDCHLLRMHMVFPWPSLAVDACGFPVTYTCCRCLWFSHDLHLLQTVMWHTWCIPIDVAVLDINDKVTERRVWGASALCTITVTAALICNINTCNVPVMYQIPALSNQ